MNAPRERRVSAVERAARLLDLLGSAGRDRSVDELARELEAPVGSTRDLLGTLRYHSLVERDPTTGRYRLGLGLARLARVALDRLDVRRVAQPLLAALCARTDETVLLGVRDEEHVVIADVHRPDHDLHIAVEVGQRLPLAAGALGKVFLAPPRAFEAFLERGGELPAYTPNSQTDVDVYAAELAVVRARGYALDDEEYLPGVRTAAAPILGPLREPAGALAVAGFKSRVPLTRLEALGDACRVTAEAIGELLGGAGEVRP